MIKRTAIMSLVLMLVLPVFFAAVVMADTEGNIGEVQIPVSSHDFDYIKEAFDSMRASRQDIVTDQHEIKVQLKQNSSLGTGTATLIRLDSTDSRVIFNKAAFYDATDKSRKDALGVFVSQLQDSRVSNQVQQNIYNSISGSSPDVSRVLLPLVLDSTSADMFSAMKIIRPFLPVLRVLLGLATIFLSFLLIASTVVDLAYIGFPLFRGKMDDSAENKGRSKAFFISADALSVVKEVEGDVGGSGGYRNVYFLYLKRRIWTYIVFAVCILYLVVGEIGGLVAKILSLGDGFLGLM